MRHRLYFNYKPQNGVPGSRFGFLEMDHLQCSISRTFFSDRPEVLGVGDGMGEGVGLGEGGKLWVCGWYFWLFYSHFWVNTIK